MREERVMFHFLTDHPMITMLALMFLGSGAYYIYQVWLRPQLIPESEIAVMAEELLAQHGLEARNFVTTLMDRAERRVELFEQGRLRRVLNYLEARQPPI